jgi:hypothetical protein
VIGAPAATWLANRGERSRRDARPDVFLGGAVASRWRHKGGSGGAV